MFPIKKASLPILQISDYWAREIYPPASKDELLGSLVSAWWLAELRGDSKHSRLQLLKLMFTSAYRDDLGIVFIVGGDAAPPPVELPDGSCKIDVRPQIRVPSSNIESWDEAACTDAFHALAEATEGSSIDSYREFAGRSEAVRRLLALALTARLGGPRPPELRRQRTTHITTNSQKFETVQPPSPA